MMTIDLWRLLPVLAFLAGCASIAPAPVQDSGAPTRIEAGRSGTQSAGIYTVKKGDTLYSIALDQGVDYRELIIWNRLDNPNRIRAGQSLLVTAPDAVEKPAVVADGVSEVRPISSGGSPVGRSLDEQPQAAVSPAPTFVETDTEQLKRTPKGGKLPYSEANLARLKGEEAAPAPAVAAAPQPAPVAEQPPALPPEVNPSVAWIWPSGGKIVATFSDGSGAGASKGVDFAGKVGEPVLAAADGKVIHVGSEIRGLGKFVVVKHAQEFLTVYGNNSRILIKPNQMVTRGQKIAELGDSDADQPKLHFEIRQQGKPVDPLRFLPPR